jgi:hypothetical protein
VLLRQHPIYRVQCHPRNEKYGQQNPAAMFERQPNPSATDATPVAIVTDSP